MGLSNSAKWQKIPFLVSAEELEDFLAHLGEVELFRMGKLSEENRISSLRFIALYKEYLESLSETQTPHKLDTFLASCDPKAVKITEIPKKGSLVSAALPALIFQPCGIKFDPINQEFQVLSFGKDALSWGWQIAYPQLFHDPVTCTIHNTLKEQERFLNTPIFKRAQKWMRMHTRPAKFSVQMGELRAVPVRLGKNAKDWVEHHQQLKAHKIHVE